LILISLNHGLISKGAHMMTLLPNENRPALTGKLGNSNEIMLPNNNSPHAQRASMLHWFLKVSYRLSTLDARERLGIMSPACRIFELRNMGHNIPLEWTYQEDSTGTLHRVGVYVYMGLTQPVIVEEA
jgi:hypothetical protein